MNPRYGFPSPRDFGGSVSDPPDHYPLVVGAALVDAPTARLLVQLLADGRRRGRVEGWHEPSPLRRTLAALDRLGGLYRVQAVPEDAERAPVWVSTSDAAALLEVSERRVRQMRAEGKLPGRRRAA